MEHERMHECSQLATLIELEIGLRVAKANIEKHEITLNKASELMSKVMFWFLSSSVTVVISCLSLAVTIFLKK